MGTVDPTIETFLSHVGDVFRATTADVSSELELIETREHTANPNATQGFSLLFRGPADVVYEQQIFEVSHDVVGTHAIFLVPVDQNEEGTYYEAVFSR